MYNFTKKGGKYMNIEYELRVLEIDIDNVIKSLEKIGAERIGAFEQKRYVYDFKPAVKGKWIRLRSNGIENTLTIKEIINNKIDGTKELEIEVSSFEETNKILNKLGYKHRSFQENNRIEYKLNNVKFDIDTWPMIPTYLEIEGKDELEIKKALNLLNLTNPKITTLGVDAIYKEIYNINIDNITNLLFE